MSLQNEQNKSTETIEIAETYEVPDGGYGWVCVVSCLVINALSWGLVSPFGVYLSYYIDSGTLRATSSDYAWIGGLTFAASMACTPLVSKLSRQYRSRPPMLAGAIMMGGGYIAASFATQIWHLYLSQGVLVGLGVGFLYLPGIAILPQWFEKKRSLANGISSAGSGLGGLTFSLLAGVMIRNISIQWALRITGIVGMTGNLLAVLLIRDRDDVIKPKHSSFNLQVLKRWDVALLLAWVFIHQFGYITIQFSMSDFARSIGLSHSRADIATALLNVGTACGRPFIGVLSDRFGRIEVAAIFTFVTGILCFALWLPAMSFALTTVYVLLVGGIYGVFWATVGPLCAEIIGLKLLPSLLPWAWFTAILPTLTGEYISLKIRNPSSSRAYLWPQIFSGLTYLIGAICLWRLKFFLRPKQSQVSLRGHS